jgi:Tfp pilus assembly protein PilX
MPNCNKKGVILFIVIGVIMVVAMLSIVILRTISNQSRLTHHQLSRIQAQYAAKAGVLYALDKLRRNDDASWTVSGPHTMCRSSSCDINESSLPTSIQQVDINVYNPETTGPLAGTRKVTAKATYTYSP